MRARVRSDEGRSLKFCRSVDEEAVRAAHLPRRRSGSDESEAARGRSVHVHRRVKEMPETQVAHGGVCNVV